MDFTLRKRVSSAGPPVAAGLMRLNTPEYSRIKQERLYRI
jgi:hypothetical protein